MKHKAIISTEDMVDYIESDFEGSYSVSVLCMKCVKGNLEVEYILR